MGRRLEVVPLLVLAACGGSVETGSTQPTDSGPDRSTGGAPPDASLDKGADKSAPVAESGIDQSAGGAGPDASQDINGTGGAGPDASKDATKDINSTGGIGLDATADQGADCGPWGTAGSDPAPAPINCNDWVHGKFWKAEAYFDGTELRIVLRNYTGYGEWTDLNALVAPELGTLQSITVDSTSYSPTMEDAVVIQIAAAAGTNGGSVTVDGVLHGQDQCHLKVACPAHRVLQIKMNGDAGPPSISLNSPAQLLPGKVTLRLESTEGTEARVVAQGVPEGAEVTFSATEGEYRADGACAVWALPSRAGIYQLEVVAKHEGNIATDALVVEIREADATYPGSGSGPA